MAACAGIGHYVKQINERKVSMDALKDAPVLELRPIGTIHPPFRSRGHSTSTFASKWSKRNCLDR